MSRRLVLLLLTRGIQQWMTAIKISSSHGVIVLLMAALFLTACGQNSASEATAVPSPTPADSEAALPATATAQIMDSAVTAAPTAPPKPLSERDTASQDIDITAEDVQLYPVSKIISGDIVTFQVQPDVPEEVAIENVTVDIYVDGQLVSADHLAWRNWDGKAQGFFEWVWDTSGLPGYHDIRVVLDGQDLIKEGDSDPANNETTFSVRVGKSSERPLEERDASWITAENDCCVVHALTRTAAYREFPELLVMLDSAVSEASSRLNEFPEKKINVYFIDRTIGQGGYAGADMVVVYNDRPYIGGELNELLVHEAVHIIDRQFAPQRIKILAEGVAVWAAGGHYNTQDLQERAAALLAINEYIPLAELADNFYPAQHEIGYLEAGAFVDFLVERYGWAEVREFYSDTSISDGVTEAEALDANLQRYFDASLAEMEAAWLAELAELSPSAEAIADLTTSIRYYDTARTYQTIHDPTAYFRTAWLPHPSDVVESGNPADFLRKPDTEANFIAELMLRSAYDAMEKQDFSRANVLLDSLERFLNPENGTTDPLAATYQDVVHTTVAFGYEPHRVTLSGNKAQVLATTATGIRLFDLDLELSRGDWILHSN